MDGDPHRVALSFSAAQAYGRTPPYHAPGPLPEYPFAGSYCPDNPAYTAVRDCLALLGLDAPRLGTPAWNPLGGIVRPGDRVLVKPNLIAHQPANSDAWECVITHGSVLRAVVDYVLIALAGRGSVLIADAPQEDSDMDAIRQRLGVGPLLEFYARRAAVPVEFLDLRNHYRVSRRGVYVQTRSLPGDPRGNARVNLGGRSHFAEVDGAGRRYYGAFYDVDETNAHHSEGRHEYMISRSALEADVFISVPKLKTHKKVGVTLNLKGLVGLNGAKNWLPHYALGAPGGEAGDQFPCGGARQRLENSLVIRAKELLLKRNPLATALAGFLKPWAYRLFGATDAVVRSGNWHGNDTCWRMVLDLNRALLYATPEGVLAPERKRYFSIVDGLVAMEGDGPVAGRPRPAGLVAAGSDPAAVDAVCAAAAGLDYRKMPMIARAFDPGEYALSRTAPGQVAVVSNQAGLAGALDALLARPPMRFAPHFGWKGFVESAP